MTYQKEVFTTIITNINLVL